MPSTKRDFLAIPDFQREELLGDLGPDDAHQRLLVQIALGQVAALGDADARDALGEPHVDQAPPGRVLAGHALEQEQRVHLAELGDALDLRLLLVDEGDDLGLDAPPRGLGGTVRNSQ